MAEENRKISFGFAKSIKKPTLVKQVPQEEKKVDYIDCVDEKAIKVIGEEEKKEEPLVIPLLGPKTWHDRIVNKIDADIFESKIANKNDTQAVKIKEEPKEASNGDLTLVNNSVSNVQIKTEPPDESESKTLTLEEQAAKEIIEDLKSSEKKDDKLSDLTLPLTEGQNLSNADESTLENYDEIPVNAFGLALLRGMGWKPGKGIGKNEKVVQTVIPKLRPKGMGLGADKVALQKQNGKPQKEEEELRIEKGSFIKIIVGKQSNTYGQIEGFEDEGRLIVKMALGGNTFSVNEGTVRAVTKAEYLKNSKVLNATKYEEYKNKEGTRKKRSTSLSSDSDTCVRKKRRKEDEDRHKSKKSSKKSKSRRRDTSGSDSDSKRKHKRRGSSSSSDTHKKKKTKKSKKHKERDNERERRKDKKSKYSESPDKRKSNKHRRSRSSSKR